MQENFWGLWAVEGGCKEDDPHPYLMIQPEDEEQWAESLKAAGFQITRCERIPDYIRRIFNERAIAKI